MPIFFQEKKIIYKTEASMITGILNRHNSSSYYTSLDAFKEIKEKKALLFHRFIDTKWRICSKSHSYLTEIRKKLDYIDERYHMPITEDSVNRIILARKRDLSSFIHEQEYIWRRDYNNLFEVICIRCNDKMITPYSSFLTNGKGENKEIICEKCKAKE